MILKLSIDVNISVNGPPQDLPCLSSCGSWEQKHNLPGKMLNEDVLKKPRRPPNQNQLEIMLQIK